MDNHTTFTLAQTTSKPARGKPKDKVYVYTVAPTNSKPSRGKPKDKNKIN